MTSTPSLQARTNLILHICLDEKFVDRASREFDLAAPQGNRYVILGEPAPLRFVKNTSVEFLTIDQVSELVRLPEYCAVIFHSLPELTLLRYIPAGKTVIWIGWGYDYYDRLLSNAFQSGLLLPKTRSIMDAVQDSGLVGNAWRKFRRKANEVFEKVTSRERALLQRVDYFSPVLDLEYHMAIELNPWFTPKHVCWTYGTVEDDLIGANIDHGSNAGNILVGNSATPTNNHVEVFDAMKQGLSLEGRSIVVPLSYGDPDYGEHIIRIGKEYFGDHFVPLQEFVSAEQYRAIMADCEVVIMNHLRQQSYANVSTMMLMGRKIYLNSQGVLYKWLVEKGAIVSPLDVLLEQGSRARQSAYRLSESERRANYDLIMSLRSRSVQREKTRNLVRIATGECA